VADDVQIEKNGLIGLYLCQSAAIGATADVPLHGFPTVGPIYYCAFYVVHCFKYIHCSVFLEAIW
jgi:hypothetical protein